MLRQASVDRGRGFDWGKTSRDYARFRPGPPDSFYRRLEALGVGLPGQRILDLGTGTGVLARRFARHGAVVAGCDVAPEQVEMARALAEADGVTVDFRVAPAEQTPFLDHSFDVATANQCWLYFDAPKVVAELRRVLVPGGWIVTSHFNWLPRRDPVAGASEELILKYNPQWSGVDFSGEVPDRPGWADLATFSLVAMFRYDEAIPFTRETWRGRMRACRGVGAALAPEEVEAFDRELGALLAETTAESFAVLHRLDVHILDFRF